MFSRYLRALVLALVVASAFALPAPGTALAQEEYIVPWLADAEDVSPEYLARIVRAYRVQHGIKANRNVAAVTFKYPNGQPGVFAVHSAPYSKGGEPPNQPQGHAERRLFKILSSLGIDTDTAKLLHSEREPCVLPGAYCRNMIGREWKGLEKVTYSYPYGPDKTERVASNRALGQEVRGY